MDFRDLKEFLKDSLKYIIVTIIVFVIFIYVVSMQQVVGPSMMPNYENGQIYILNKIQYRIVKPKRFEVIVLNSKEAKYMIKRIIGLPGEKIEYKNNKLYVNGEKILEEFERNGEIGDYNIEGLNGGIIPENCYFVLGDNRENSMDSRSFGFVSANDIVGKVEFRIWPILK